jgi:hypothetical protein
MRGAGPLRSRGSDPCGASIRGPARAAPRAVPAAPNPRQRIAGAPRSVDGQHVRRRLRSPAPVPQTPADTNIRAYEGGIMIRRTALWFTLAAALGAGALVSAPAAAGGVAWSVSIGGPGFAVTAGAPGYWGPRPYYRPYARAYAPVVYPAPAVYAAPVVAPVPYVATVATPVVVAPRVYAPRRVVVPVRRPVAAPYYAY